MRFEPLSRNAKGAPSCSRIVTAVVIIAKELGTLSVDMRARFARICQLIAAVGLEHVGAPHVRRLTGPLWEMRMSGRDGISRALYVTAGEKRVVAVRVFVKKTPKTPRRENDLALRRAGEVTG